MKINNEIKIGMLVCLVAVLLSYITIKSGKFNISEKGHTVKVLFDNIDGVNLNSPVMLNGYEIGIVEDVQIKEVGSDTKMELTLWLETEVRLRKGSKAFVKSLGFLGEKYIGLTSGNNGEDFLSENVVILGEEPKSFDKLISDGEVISIQIKEITKNINDRLNKNKEEFDGILENLNAAMKNVASVAESVDTRLEVNAQNIDFMVHNLASVSVNLEELTRDVKENPWKLIYKSKEDDKDLDKEREGDKD